MNTDFRVKLSFFSHHKTKKVRFQLGIKGAYGVLQLFAHVSAHKPSGVLSDMDELDIALAGGWEGDPEKFVQALRKARYLDYDETTGVYSIHDWAEHNPWAAKAEERSAQARAAANTRHHGNPDGVDAETNNQTLTGKNHAVSTDEHCGQHETAVRVAKNSNAPSPSSPIPTSPNPSTPHRPPPTWLLKDGSEFKPEEEKVREWIHAFPDVDVPAQLRACAQWSRDNEDRRKTRVRINEHIRAWLDDKQNPKDGRQSNASRPTSRGRGRRESAVDAADRRLAASQRNPADF